MRRRQQTHEWSHPKTSHLPLYQHRGNHSHQLSLVPHFPKPVIKHGYDPNGTDLRTATPACNSKSKAYQKRHNMIHPWMILWFPQTVWDDYQPIITNFCFTAQQVIYASKILVGPYTYDTRLSFNIATLISSKSTPKPTPQTMPSFCSVKGSIRD